MVKKVKYPIALKLITIISGLVILSLSIVTSLATYFIRLDVQLTAEQSNHTINTQTADIAENLLIGMRDNAMLLVNALSFMNVEDASRESYTNLFFEKNVDIAAIAVPNSYEIVNTNFFVEYNIDVDSFHAFIENSKSAIERAKTGEVVAINATANFNVPTVALLLPWHTSELQSAIVIIFSVEGLTETFGSGTTNTSYMINDKNDILIHPDFDLMYSASNVSNVSLVSQMRNNNDKNRQVVFSDLEGKEFFGAYTKLPIGDIGVITTIETDLVFEAVNTTFYQNGMLAMSVLFLSIIFIRFFSKSITRPVKILTEASEQIEQGNFSLSLKPRSKDEVGVLTSRFVSMCKGLETFGRFVNLDIALKAMKGDLHLGGETKNVTIFFSDIRSFTEISEKLEPSEVIEFLNDYMTRMVDCVNQTEGSVDKFIGDAVMAVWGASSSTGNAESDALNAIRTTLMMRAALQEFNKGRGSEHKPIIKIGCGLNSGSVVAGQMGSMERMEYTVIGDAVNLASRTETLSKLFCTDILITENTYELVKEHVIVEKMPSVTVKGKEKPVVIYALINMPNETTIPGAGKEGPKTIEEVRSILGFPTPDLNNVDVNAEERKYNLEK